MQLTEETARNLIKVIEKQLTEETGRLLLAELRVLNAGSKQTIVKIKADWKTAFQITLITVWKTEANCDRLEKIT